LNLSNPTFKIGKLSNVTNTYPSNKTKQKLKIVRFIPLSYFPTPMMYINESNLNTMVRPADRQMIQSEVR